MTRTVFLSPTQTFQILTFQEWLVANPDLGEAASQTPCTSCAGTGDDTCNECGTIVDCEDCGGTGYSDAPLLIYEAQRQADVAQLKRSTLVSWPNIS